VRNDPEELGRRLARRYRVGGVRPEPSALARDLQVSVTELPAPPPAQSDLRAEYRHEPPQIILYRAPLEQLAAAIHASQRLDLLACDLVEVHLAHELFHHLEFGGRFGPLRPDEIETAAHAFAQEYCALPFDPRELSGIR
jgi:hypothetical protein